MKSYITSAPQILNGKPVIVGTRIPIQQILFLIKEGYTIQSIQEEYPTISLTILQGVIDELLSDVENRQYGSKVFQI